MIKPIHIFIFAGTVVFSVLNVGREKQRLDSLEMPLASPESREKTLFTQILLAAKGSHVPFWATWAVLIGELIRIPSHRILCCGGNRQIHTDYRVPWRKRDCVATLSRGEHPTLALTGFHCFSRPLTSKMVLLYYAKVCFGWLSFADKG